MIRKRRKIVNGVEITLLEKTTSIVDQSLFYANVENNLKTYIDDKISDQSILSTLQQTQTPITQSETSTALPMQLESLLSGMSFSDDQFFDIVANEPEEGSILTYDGLEKNLVWRQTPNVRFDEIINSLLNYNSYFNSEYLQSNKLHLPFAVKWTTPPYWEWGGPGKAGIFWGDPWNDMTDHYSIKVGGDDEEIGEAGYTYGAVTSLAMKFSNSTDSGRGFVWNAQGAGGGPVMSLSTGSAQGRLLVKEHIFSETGNIYASDGTLVGNDLTLTEPALSDLVGHMQISSYNVTTGNSFATLFSSTLTADHNNYVLGYTYAGANIGKVSLLPPNSIGTKTKALTLLSPQSVEDITLWRINSAITLTNLRTVLLGTGTPTVSWSLRYNSDRNASGTQAILQTASGTTTGDEYTTFIQSELGKDLWLWLEVSSTGGTTVDQFHMTISYTEDP